MNDKPAEKDLRTQQIEARKKRMRELNPPRPSVRVTPANDELRKALKHPKTGMKFPESGSAEWPLDQFTRRRIKDGSVTREEREPEHDQRGRRGRSSSSPDAA